MCVCVCVHREHPLALVAVQELLSLGMRGTDIMSVVMTAVPQFSTCEWSVTASGSSVSRYCNRLSFIYDACICVCECLCSLNLIIGKLFCWVVNSYV